jgi:hypothetical protein
MTVFEILDACSCAICYRYHFQKYTLCVPFHICRDSDNAEGFHKYSDQMDLLQDTVLRHQISFVCWDTTVNQGVASRRSMAALAGLCNGVAGGSLALESEVCGPGSSNSAQWRR